LAPAARTTAPSRCPWSVFRDRHGAQSVVGPSGSCRRSSLRQLERRHPK
jgi:hypothetical protein